MEFRVLGPLEVRRADATVPLGSRRLRALLAALLVEAGRVVSVDALAAALWGDDPPAAPRNAIQTYVARLREALGDDAPLVTRSPGYLLEVAPDQLDALRFEQLLAEAREHREQPQVVRDRLRTALELWRGPAYAEFADHVARTEALRLDELRLAAVEELAAARLALGEAADLVAQLEAEVADHPLRERLVELHMEALAATDRTAEALAAYRGYRHHLAEETGLEPSPSISELEGRILRGELAATPHAGRTTTGPAVRPTTTTPPPVAPTSRIGREQEIADTRAALEHHRVVTLTGPGGVGKSRLAAEVAAQVAAEAVMEAAWVELGPVTDPLAIEHVVAVAAGIDLGGGAPPRPALLRALSGRQLLLVLDNTEHLLDTVAPLVEEIQRTAQQVRVLATGRERLAVVGERVLPVEPLATSTDDDGDDPSDAARLFLERASEANGRGAFTPHLPLVTELCQELDGLPLAIELAAARTAALSLEDLLTALRDGRATAAGHRRGQTGRHRDLWAVVDWSWRLLAEDEQWLFARLGVFAGSFGVDEAHEVAAPEGWDRSRTLEQLAALSERSLLARPSGHPDEEPARYRLLGPLRAFARQRLADRGELEALTDRHARVLIERAEHAAGPPLSEAGRRWLEASLDDLREVRRHATAHAEAELLGRLIAALYRFDYWRPGSELHGWAEDALGFAGSDLLPTAPQLHAAAATAAWRRGELDRARHVASLGTQLGTGSDDPARTVAFEALGDAVNFAGELDEARDAYREQERLARLAGDPDSEALAVSSAALVLAYDGRPDEATDEAGRALQLAGGAGPATQAFARYAYGECLAEHDPDRAIELVAEAADLAHDANAWFVTGVAQLTLASLRARHHEPRSTLPLFSELLDHWHRSGSWTQLWTTLRNLVELLVRLHADEDAAAIAGAIEAQPSANAAFGAESDRLADALAGARHRLGDARFAAAYERGATLTAADVVDVARARIGELRD